MASADLKIVCDLNSQLWYVAEDYSKKLAAGANIDLFEKKYKLLDLQATNIVQVCLHYTEALFKSGTLDNELTDIRLTANSLFIIQF